MCEYTNAANGMTRAEFVNDFATHAGARIGFGGQCEWVDGDRITGWYVDSSWKPPLDLPTEPGSVVLAEGPAQVKRLWFCRSDGTWMNENGTINEATALTVLHEVLFDAGTGR